MGSRESTPRQNVQVIAHPSCEGRHRGVPRSRRRSCGATASGRSSSARSPATSRARARSSRITSRSTRRLALELVRVSAAPATADAGGRRASSRRRSSFDQTPGSRANIVRTPCANARRAAAAKEPWTAGAETARGSRRSTSTSTCCPAWIRGRTWARARALRPAASAVAGAAAPDSGGHA